MDSLSVALFSVTGILIFLATAATVLRCWVRIRILKAFGMDDYFMIASLVFYILAESFIFDATNITHDKTIPELVAVVGRARRGMYLGEVFYCVTVWMLKLSVGTFLLRLVTKKLHRHLILGTLAIVSLYSISYTFTVIFQCTPIDHFWKPFKKGKCIPGRTSTYTSYTHSAIIGSSDLVFAIIPIFMVWDLQMNLAMKLSVGSLLSIGAIAGITTFIRMPYIKALEEASVFDFVKVTSKLAIWTSIEPGLGIFVGSLATLRPLFRKILGGSGIFSSRNTNPSGSRAYGNRYWPSSRSNVPYQMDSFTDANRKCVTTTVVEGTRTSKIGKKKGSMMDSVMSKTLSSPSGSGSGGESDEEALTRNNRSMASVSVGRSAVSPEGHDGLRGGRRNENDRAMGIGIHRSVVLTTTDAVPTRNASSPTYEESFEARGGFY